MSVFARLRLPVIGAPMFIISRPALVGAQCRAGVIVLANYLRSSIEAAGLDPDRLATSDPSAMSFATASETGASAKAWRDIRGCGQGIGAIEAVVSVADLVGRFESEYRAAKESLR